MSPDRSHPRAFEVDRHAARLRRQSRRARCGYGQRMSRRGRTRKRAGEQRAGCRRGQHRRRPGRCLRYHRRHPHCHRAVMRSMPTAAGRQTRVVAGFERPRQGPQPEEQ